MTVKNGAILPKRLSESSGSSTKQQTEQSHRPAQASRDQWVPFDHQLEAGATITHSFDIRFDKSYLADQCGTGITGPPWSTWAGQSTFSDAVSPAASWLLRQRQTKGRRKL